MDPAANLAIDGYVTAVPMPGSSWGTATFDLIPWCAQADRITHPAPTTVYACTTGDPRIADVLLQETRPGDRLRVTGTAIQPLGPEAPIQLTVEALDVLEAAPLPDRGMVLERYGSYLVIFDADRDQVPVFTTDGTWVGEAATPSAVGEQIAAFEHRQRAGEE
ncbi:hypothetical protein AB0D13_23235 [Streptomyces sp. NPDC048430]|uniref:hypothetical protein n=1 Tax=Streptomyces sp. NPDC048430 TaxID=3155388 RepID=UPI00344AC448